MLFCEGVNKIKEMIKLGLFLPNLYYFLSKQITKIKKKIARFSYSHKSKLRNPFNAILINGINFI